jgi:predicted nucleotidyltransferase
MSPSDLLEQNRDEILRLAARYGATDVRVFGSVARGEAHEGSDVDFLVRMEPGRSIFDLAALVAELKRYSAAGSMSCPMTPSTGCSAAAS